MSGYIYLDGTINNGPYAADAAALDATADLDIRVEVALADYTPAAAEYLLGKIPGDGTTGYAFNVNADGTLRLVIGDGSAHVASSSAATGITNGERIWLRVTYDASEDDVLFYTSTDGSGWDQLGTLQAVGATSITTNTNILTMGSAGGAAAIIGGLYNALVYIDASLELDCDFTDLTAGEVSAGSFTEDSSNAATITIAGSAWEYHFLIEPGLVDQTAAAVDPSVAVEDVGQTISPALVDQTAAAVDPAVTTGNVNIAPSLVDRTAAAVDPSVAVGGVSIAPSLVSQSLTAVDPAITTGNVNIAPALADQTAAAVDPALTSNAYITPGTVFGAIGSIDPTITTGNVNIAPSLVDQTAAAVDPEVSVAAAGQTVTPSLVTQSLTPVDPAITTGNVNLAPSLVTQTLTPVDPTVTSNVTLTPGLITQTLTPVDPAVTLAGPVISPALVSQLISPSAPIVSNYVRLWPLSSIASMLAPAPEPPRVACPLCGEPLDRKDNILHCPRGDWQNGTVTGPEDRDWGGYAEATAPVPPEPRSPYREDPHRELIDT